MREIKFRVYDHDKNKMVFMSGIFGHICPYTEKSTFPQYESCPRYHMVSVMQYTGLKDRNGVEIYEGDILQDKYDNMPVFFLDEDALYAIGCENEWFYLADQAQDSIVIGNIYENPELLATAPADEEGA